MCIPVKFLKCIIHIGSVLSIAVSIALLVTTIYVQAQNKDINASTNKGFISASLTGLYVSSVVFLLLGVGGVFSSIRQSKSKERRGKCLLVIFTFGITVFFLVFLGGTILFFIAPESIIGRDCTTGVSTTLIDELYNTSQIVYGQYCKSCGCAVNNNSDLYMLLSNHNLNISSSGSFKYSECSNPAANLDNVDILSTFQTLLGCAGWCPLNSTVNATEADPINYYFFRFRDINDCNSFDCYSQLTNCHQAFFDLMSEKGRQLGVVCLVAMLICFINLVAVICICKSPTKSGKKNDFYSRMMEMD